MEEKKNLIYLLLIKIPLSFSVKKHVKMQVQ